MAELQSIRDTNNTKSTVLPKNEELIENLTAGLEKECVVMDKSKHNKCSDHKPNYNEPLESANNQIGSESHSLGTESNDDEGVSSIGFEIPTNEEDLIDELAMKDLELTYSEEDKKRLQCESQSLKQSANELFKCAKYEEAAVKYTQALRTCPLVYDKDRSILYSNRAAAKMKLGNNESAIEDCSKSLELDERYIKALVRRAQLYEATDKLDEALADYTKVLEIDPLHSDALYGSKRLPHQIHERNEKLKTEMLGKLKDLGNMILKPFGLSTDNFQLNQDPNSSGYSVNFKS